MDIRSHTYADKKDNDEHHNKNIATKPSEEICISIKEKQSVLNIEKLQIVEDKCAICKQNGNCISLNTGISKNIVICEYCYRKILFSGISNIKYSDLGWKVAFCDSCKTGRLKSDNEVRFCNCI
jgi:hypothetical protein